MEVVQYGLVSVQPQHLPGEREIGAKGVQVRGAAHRACGPKRGLRPRDVTETELNMTADDVAIMEEVAMVPVVVRHRAGLLEERFSGGCGDSQITSPESRPPLLRHVQFGSAGPITVQVGKEIDSHSCRRGLLFSEDQNPEGVVDYGVVGSEPAKGVERLGGQENGVFYHFCRSRHEMSVPFE